MLARLLRSQIPVTLSVIACETSWCGVLCNSHDHAKRRRVRLHKDIVCCITRGNPNSLMSARQVRKTDHKTLSCVCLDDPPRQSDTHHLTPPAKPALIRLVRIGLVGCVKNKLTTTATAQDLYVSQLFRGRRWYVEQTCDIWFVMSSPHIVVEPAASVAPYDATLVGSARQTRRRWA